MGLALDHGWNRATRCLAGLAPTNVFEARSPRLMEELFLHRPTTDLDDTWEYNPDTFNSSAYTVPS